MKMTLRGVDTILSDWEAERLVVEFTEQLRDNAAKANAGVVAQLRQAARPTPDDHDVYPNLQKLLMKDAADTIERLSKEKL